MKYALLCCYVLGFSFRCDKPYMCMCCWLLLPLTPLFIAIHICTDTIQLCAWAANWEIYVSNAFYLAPVGPGGSFQHPSASR